MENKSPAQNQGVDVFWGMSAIGGHSKSKNWDEEGFFKAEHLDEVKSFRMG